MKKVYFHNQNTVIKIGDTIFEAGLKEIELEVFTSKENIIFEPTTLDLKEGENLIFKCPTDFTAEITATIDPNFYRKFLKPRPMFRQFIVEYPGFISAQAKQTWQTLEENEYLFSLRFRQMIFPRLAVQVKFLTLFEFKDIDL